jgi:hypothetical protein
MLSPNLLYQLFEMNYLILYCHSLGGNTPHDCSLMLSYSGMLSSLAALSMQANSELRQYVSVFRYLNFLERKS